MRGKSDLAKTRGFLKGLRLPSDKIVLFLAFAFIVAFFSIMNKNFFSWTNLINVLIAASLTGIVAIGATYLIIGAMNDLSSGSIVAFSGVLAGILSASLGLGFAAVLPLTLIAGGLIGCFNAFMVTKLELDPFIATLVTQSVFRGFAFILFGGKAIPVKDRTFLEFGTSRVLDVPIPVIILLLSLAVFGVILSKTTFGRSIYVIGGNKDAARLAGLNPKRIAYISYIITGVLCALGGLTLAGRMGSGQPTASVGLEFDAITAVILGGVSFSGGVGGMVGTILGVLILQSFNTGLTMISVPTFWQYVARGMLLLLALALDHFRKTSRERRLIEDSMKSA
jgi:ribose/xylose/arabinose/galactoside ABC-type transport system permease subunit